MQITVYNLYDFFGSQDFQRDLERALREVGIMTVAVLKDDARVERAALFIYDNLPAYMRVIVSVTLGKEGFVRFIFQLRDKLIEHNRLDLSWLDLRQIKILILAQFKTQGFSEYIWVFSGKIMDGRSIVFEFRGPAKQTPKIPFQSSYLLGRSTDFCHIVIPDQRISRKHAEISYFPERGLCIRDLKSTNGTYLNGKRIGKTYKPVCSGAQLALGELMLTVHSRH